MTRNVGPVVPLRFADADLGEFAPFGRSFCRQAASRFPGVTDRLRFAGIGCERLERSSPGVGFTLDRFDGTGFLRLSSPAAFALVEHVLGADGAEADSILLDRDLTPLEMALMPRLLPPLLTAWELAFESLVRFEPSHETGDGPFVVWHIDGRFGPALDLAISAPCARAMAREFAPPPRSGEAGELLNAVACPEVLIGRVRTTIGALAALRPGLIIELSCELDEPWIVSCGGLDIVGVRPAALDGRPHLLVTERTVCS